MKTKKLFLAAIMVLVGISVTFTSAWAGSKQRHRWEGVAIGVGAAVVGGAILNSVAHGAYVPAPAAVSVNYVEHRVEHHYVPDHGRHHYRRHCCDGRGPKHGWRKHHRHGHDRHHGYRKHHRHCDD